ncbi:MAG: SAM-dependent methyltransferase [Epsilonproteobacteria bacterium]|nr:MAG: SAM-dependent methyltransferase [Campylobacterota bacterium]
MQAHNKASAWFDGLYKNNKTSQENIPWARQSVNPLLQTYLDTDVEHQGRALVIGCGLGDDAIALEKAGYVVTAIDVSQTALDLAQERFRDSKVQFVHQDIFEYEERFDFVFEALTIQSLPIEFRQKMIRAVANTVAKNAKLLLVAHQRKAMVDGPPWPLTKEEVDLFKEEGLTELSHELHTEESKVSNVRFRVLYQRN